MGKYVMVKPFVYLRRAVLHGLDGVKHEGKFFVFNLYGAYGLRRAYLVPRDYRGHIVPIIANVAVEQKPVRNVLMMHIRAPGMPRRGERNIRHVKAGDYFHHALYPFGLACIYAFNIAVRNC